MEVKNYADIKKSLIEHFVANQKKITDFNSGSVIDTLFDSFAREEEKKYIATKLGFMQNLRAIPYSLFDFERKEGTYSSGTVIFSRGAAKDFDTVIPVGTVVAGNGKQYVTTEVGVINNGDLESNQITVRSVEVGAENNVETNVISEIVSALSSDVVAVRNNIRTSGGHDEENEIEMLKRFKDFLAGLQGTSIYGLKSAASKYARSVNVVENFDSGALYRVTVYAEDGSGNLTEDIKKKIVNEIEGDGNATNPGKRAPGINVLVTGPEIVAADFDITVTTYRADPETSKMEILNVVKDYVNSLGIGENVILTSIMLQIRSLAYVRDVVINSPSANILIAGNQIVRFNSAEIHPVEE